MIDRIKPYVPSRDLLILGTYGALIVGLYYSTLSYLFYQLRIWEDYNYGFLIPAVVLYLIWEKRDQLLSEKAARSYAGLCMAALGLVLFWLGELGGELFIQYLSLWLLISGLTWMHLGWAKFKVILFPVAFLLTMFPLPHFITATLTMKLKLISSKLGVMTLQALGRSAYREGNVIDLGFTQLQVVDACSGLRYLFPLIVLSVLLAYFYKSAWWKKAIVVCSAVPISIVINGMRIASAGLLYPIWGARVVEGFFHDFSGWLIFMLSMGILLAEMRFLNVIFKEKGSRARNASSSGQGALPLPGRNERIPHPAAREKNAAPLFKGISLHFRIGVVLLAASLAVGFAVDFREKTVALRSVGQFPKAVGPWTGVSQEMEGQILNALHLSDYAMMDFINQHGKSVNFYVAYYESQSKAESIHSPSTCLPAGGWVFDQAGKTAVPLGASDATIPVNRAVMLKGDARQLSYYWFNLRGRIATHMWQVKLYNFWDALTRRRTDGALVRLITPIYANESLETAERRLQGFMSDVVPVLDEFLPQ